MTASLETLHVLPQVSAAARTLISTAILVGPAPIFAALTWRRSTIDVNQLPIVCKNVLIFRIPDLNNSKLNRKKKNR